MVRHETKHVPFVCCMAASTIGTLCVLGRSGPEPWWIPVLSGTLVLLSLSLAVRSLSSSVPSRPSRPGVAVALFLGVILGFASSARIAFERSYFSTLASESSASGVTAIVLSDPARRGEAFSCRVRMEELSLPDGSRFSCGGYATVLLPRSLVSRYEPRGLSENGKAYRVASGELIRLNGSFGALPPGTGGGDPQGRVFRAESFAPEPEFSAGTREETARDRVFSRAAAIRSSARLYVT